MSRGVKRVRETAGVAAGYARRHACPLRVAFVRDARGRRRRVRPGQTWGARPTLDLTLLPDALAVCRLPAGAASPPWLEGEAFAAVTRTPEETSVVCRAEVVPQGVRAEPGWRALRVAGPLDFALTGVLLSLVEPLAAAGVSVFALSTFDTDYVLVREAALEEANAALTRAGHRIAGTVAGAGSLGGR
jgi:uncharacterized protein